MVHSLPYFRILIAINISERSKFGEPIWTWAYPSLTESQKSYVTKKTPIEDQKTFFYGKVKNIWFYVSDLMEGDPEKFPDVSILFPYVFLCICIFFLLFIYEF